jgi:BMFP domain-containing protein YqiC
VAALEQRIERLEARLEEMNGPTTLEGQAVAAARGSDRS